MRIGNSLAIMFRNYRVVILVRISVRSAEREGVADRVRFLRQDLFQTDLSEATVVTLYMLPDFNAKLRPMLDRQLKPGSRVVSHDYPIEGWVPDKVERVKGDFLHDHTVMLFEIR